MEVGGGGRSEPFICAIWGCPICRVAVLVIAGDTGRWHSHRNPKIVRRKQASERVVWSGEWHRERHWKVAGSPALAPDWSPSWPASIRSPGAAMWGMCCRTSCRTPTLPASSSPAFLSLFFAFPEWPDRATANGHSGLRCCRIRQRREPLNEEPSAVRSRFAKASRESTRKKEELAWQRNLRLSGCSAVE